MHQPPKPLAANLFCFSGMMMWSVGFPLNEILLESWDPLALITVRQTLGGAFMIAIWICMDGLKTVIRAPWIRGIRVGGIGFGFGSYLFLLGQEMANAVTPAIAAAMMPVIAAIIEVLFDRRRLTLKIVVAITLVLIGGFLAANIGVQDAQFGIGTLLCVTGVVLFAWATRSATKRFSELSSTGGAAITIGGGVVGILLMYALALAFDLPQTDFGKLDPTTLSILLLCSCICIGLSQLFWIYGVAGLGIMIASFHMNAVPFYVMAIVVLFMGQTWNWTQALGAGLVAVAVMLSQSRNRH